MPFQRLCSQTIIEIAKDMADSIEYELTHFESRTVWKCAVNGHYRHRKEAPGSQPAICCGRPAKLVDRYEQPIDVEVWDEV